MFIRHATALILLVLANTAQAEVQTKTITYQDGDVECHGYLAWDDAIEGKRPGVLVVHEWWGLNDYARERTEQLAELGYVAFAADIYGEGKTTTHPADAGKMAGEVRANVDQWRTRAQAALDVLESQPQCDTSKLAAIGYCFGGATALQLAYTGANLDAVVTFHGALPAATLEEAKQIKAELLINHGADDTFVNEEAVANFKKSLDDAGVTYEFIAYPGAVHSFTVPNADSVGMPGIKYNKEADEKSWQAMRDLFERKLDK
ncbi:dienelactone hydrolase family protein [Bythopirellula polymerisocia]|uniref:Carboxymethylenebutenolidase n=1 Tax=Bythopirellula polymerisocia TaxID=2528003 RepID=A0A5C6D1Z7_9BACT|nr:dienelactone hydrolase family protein [Bythopirellula polymerisocia]TWU29677.1 Carboxymethylenebutenolidase [Bythopirellula polymerisocia]